MRGRRQKKILTVLLVAITCGLLPYGVRADAALRKDARIKAAYIYNFIKFVSWPDQVEGGAPVTVTVCAYGKNPLDHALDEIDGKEFSRGAIRVVTGDPDPNEYACDVAYFSDLRRNVESFAFGIWSKAPVLTVSDTSGFRSRGGIIEFEQAGSKIGFAINVEKAKEVELNISSKLLLLSTNKGRRS